MTSQDPVAPASGVQYVDARALTAAENARPFDAGLIPLDATSTTVVTNWSSVEVPWSAAQRLMRELGLHELPEVGDDDNLTIPAADSLSGTPSIAALRQIYARLRRPDGCPWDREQSELSTVPHLFEEANELRDALEHEDWVHAAEELGDVLGNVLMIAQIAEERGAFTFADVVTSISTKLVRRHPHVFGNQTADSAEDVLAIWKQVKQEERALHTHSVDNDLDGEATDTR